MAAWTRALLVMFGRKKLPITIRDESAAKENQRLSSDTRRPVEIIEADFVEDK
jgi:hypothetical protein